MISKFIIGQELFYNVYNYTSREIGQDMNFFEIVQDGNGKLWFRDYYSIGNYDGKSFQNMTYRLEKSAGGPQDIYDIHADTKGMVWVSGSNGLYYYTDSDGFKKWTFQSPDLKNNSFTAMVDDREGNLYLGDTASFIYKVNSISGKVLDKYQLPDKTSIKYIHLFSASIWVAANHGIYKCEETGICKKIHSFQPYVDIEIFSDNRFQKISSLSDGTLIANEANSDKLLIFSKEGKLIDKIDFNCKIPSPYINDWLQIDHHQVMVATNEGLYNYNPLTKSIQRKQNEYLVKNQFYETWIISVCKLKNNVIFLGTGINLSKLNIINEDFLNYNYIFPSKTVLVKECKKLNNHWIIVTEKDGILLYDPVSITNKKIFDVGKSAVEYARYDDFNDMLWLALNDKILKIKLHNGSRIEETYLKKGVTTSISMSKTEVWLVSGGQLYQIDQKEKKMIHHVVEDELLKQIEYHSGNTFFVSGKNIFKLTCGDIQKILPEYKDIGGMATDGGECLYFEHFRQLVKYNVKTGTKKIYDQTFGLPNESLDHLKYDNQGYIWIGTRSSGICRFDPQRGISKYFKEENGLVDNVSLGGLSLVKPGIIAIHRWQFFSYLKPNESVRLVGSSKISLKNIHINKKDKTREVLKDGIIKIPSSGSLVNMDVEYPVYMHHSFYSLQYRLKSYKDSLWSDMGEDQKIILNQIAPGDFKLEIKAINKNNPKDFAEYKLQIISLSPFYMKWWFIAICIGLTYIVIYIIYRYQKYQNQKLEKLRSDISKDLHDEMGSNLSNIMLLGEISLLNGSANTNNLKLMVDKTKDVLQSMSDIVWSINPGNDSLPNIIQKIQNTTVDVLEPLNISLTFDVHEELNACTLEMYKRQGFYMILKEAINNCAKYSQAKNVALNIYKKQKWIHASLQDDGQGFDLATIQRGNGLNNILQRSKTLGGEATIESSPGHGTKITIKFPID